MAIQPIVSLCCITCNYVVCIILYILFNYEMSMKSVVEWYEQCVPHMFIKTSITILISVSVVSVSVILYFCISWFGTLPVLLFSDYRHSHDNSVCLSVLWTMVRIPGLSKINYMVNLCACFWFHTENCIIQIPIAFSVSVELLKLIYSFCHYNSFQPLQYSLTTYCSPYY